MIDEFGKDYLLLALRIGKHIDGYVDSYFGPATLKNVVDAEEISSPKKLLAACKYLLNILEEQDFTKKRVNFLRKMLRAMETSIRLQTGNNIPYKEQIRRLHDIEPQLIDDSYFHQIAQELLEAYEGSGTLEEKMRIIRAKRKIPKEKVVLSFQKSIEFVAERTNELFPNLLPEDEKVTINKVSKKFYGVKDCYLGNFKSRIDVNLDHEYYWTSVFRIAAHEGYPGHHVEQTLKDLFLYQTKGMFEHCVCLIPSPKRVIYEGVGDIAMNVLYSYEEGARKAYELLCPNSSKEDGIESLIKQWRAGYKAIGLWTNLSYHAHVDGWNEEKLIKYGTQFGYHTKKELEWYLDFILNPLTATYSFCYSTGRQLIEKKFGEHPSPENFKMLLTQPLLPSDLV
jgi:hypothetical protein